MASEIESFQSIARAIRREVWIITAADGERRGGLVATWVNTASLDPATPRLLAAIAINHHTHDLIARSKAFAAHLITADSLELVWRFGLQSGRDVDKFAGLATDQGPLGSPILKEALAWSECRVAYSTRIAERTFFLGEVAAAESHISQEGRPPRAPLTDQDLIQLAPADQLAKLKSDLQESIAFQAPIIQAWFAGL